MNLDKPQSRYLNFVNVDFLSTTSYRSFVYTGQYLFIRVYTSTNARRPNGCPSAQRDAHHFAGFGSYRKIT